MTPEIRRRFRLALVGYVILAIAVGLAFAAVAADLHHDKQVVQRLTAIEQQQRLDEQAAQK